MNKLFPRMYNCPEGRQIAGGGLYWVVYQVMLPFILELFAMDAGGNMSTLAGLGIAWHIVNFVAVVLIFRTYLRDAWWTVRMEPKRVFASIGLGAAALAVLEIPMILSTLFNELPFLYISLPFADPLFGVNSVAWPYMNFFTVTPCLVVLAPFVMCCLYYAVGFAAPCQERPWLGYLIVTLLSAIPAVLLVTSQGKEVSEALSVFVSALPIHLCSCWVYQRSDTIWAPIFFQMILNLAGIPLNLILILSMAINSMF